MRPKDSLAKQSFVFGRPRPGWPRRRRLSSGGRYRIRTYPHSTFCGTCGTRVATRIPQGKPMEQLLDTNWTLPPAAKRKRRGKDGGGDPPYLR
jgi:hypothetical protein